MIFTEIGVAGAYLVDIEKREDARGFNARSWDAVEFEARGLSSRFVQANILYNRSRGTLRGMHYQAEPKGEDKLFRCVRGSVFDAIIDMRVGSSTYLQVATVELVAESLQQLYIPKGCAQGFQTLEDDTELIYQVSEFYAPDYERGIRFDDPAFRIRWPFEPTVMSQKDRGWPDVAVPSGPTIAR